MQPNQQFSEEQRAEAYRVESMQQIMRQTKAIESIRSLMMIWFWLTIIGGVVLVAASFSAARGF